MLQIHAEQLTTGKFLCIAVTDSGSGFSEEALRHGTEQFYQADKSRTGKKHYGWDSISHGLYWKKTMECWSLETVERAEERFGYMFPA